MTQGKEKEKLEGRFNVRVTLPELLSVKEQADISALSISEYVRRRVLGRQVKSKLDLRVLAELRKLGGLMKHLHNETRGAYSDKTAEAIQALTSYARQLEKGLNSKDDRKNSA